MYLIAIKEPVSIYHLGMGGRILGCQKGGFTHLKILLRGGRVQKIHTDQFNLQYLFLTLVNMILQKLDY